MSSTSLSLVRLPRKLVLAMAHSMTSQGAGIGGLALAISLHKKGVSFTLYEGAKEYSVVG